MWNQLQWKAVSARSRSRHLIASGLAMLTVASLGFQSSPGPVEDPLVPSGFVAGFTLPVPAGSRVIARSIEPSRWRSLLVLDLEPLDPADWADTVVILRMKPIPGVLMARSTSPCELPHPFDGSGAWWSFANGIGVKVTSHTSVLEAVGSAGTPMESENHGSERPQGLRDRDDHRSTDVVFKGSTRVEVSGDR